jgi:hypothetical protein
MLQDTSMVINKVNKKFSYEDGKILASTML